MRLKKKGLDKLKISQMEPDTDKKYEKLEVVFESVINNFKQKKIEFEKLKTKSDMELK